MTDAPRPAGQDVDLIEVAAKALYQRYKGQMVYAEYARHVDVVVAAVRPMIEREAKRAAYRDWLAYLDSSWTAGSFTSEGISQRKEREYVQTKLAALEADE